MANKLLTKRKQAWVDRRKPPTIKAGAINPSASVETRYYDQLESLIRRMTDETEAQIKRLFDTGMAEEYFAEDGHARDESISSQSRILTNRLMRRFNLLFSARSKPIAEQFANQSDKASSASVHMNLKELSGGLSLSTAGSDPVLNEILTATVAENVGLIKSISQKYLTEVQGAVMRAVSSGGGLQDLVPYLEKHKGITYRRARFIALDQTRKAMTNMSAQRMERVGLQEFLWLHTGGSDHPRELHVRMSGQIYRFDDPPIIDEKTGERGLPGKLPGCRCRMKMVMRLKADEGKS